MTDRDPWADVVVTDFGFRWGPMTVTRLASDPRFGFVLLVSNGIEEVQIRVSAKGRKLLVENRRKMVMPCRK